MSVTAPRSPLQAVILVGGRGTRLGALTERTPKPLLPVGRKPFLEHLIRNLARHGFRDIVLCAGYLAAQMTALVERAPELGVSIRCVIEPEPAGTAGAIVYARDVLAPEFLLLNGDSFFDINYLSLAAAPLGRSAGRICLRQIDNAERYGTVRLDGGRVVDFTEKSSPGPGLINGGIYWLDAGIVDWIHARPCSLERDVLPRLAATGRLEGRVFDGYFIDIGIPSDFTRAQTEVPARFRKPAVFFDRDGVINVDKGYVHKAADIEWIPGVKDLIRTLNDQGRYVFVVTNQAGVARGMYGEEAIGELHAWMAEDLRRSGAHVDDWRYCPYHPEGVVEAYRSSHPWRKPEPGMLLDLMDHWEIDRENSVLIGDRRSDVAAAEAAGVRGYLFDAANVHEFAAARGLI